MQCKRFCSYNTLLSFDSGTNNNRTKKWIFPFDLSIVCLQQHTHVHTHKKKSVQSKWVAAILSIIHLSAKSFLGSVFARAYQTVIRKGELLVWNNKYSSDPQPINPGQDSFHAKVSPGLEFTVVDITHGWGIDRGTWVDVIVRMLNDANIERFWDTESMTSQLQSGEEFTSYEWREKPLQQSVSPNIQSLRLNDHTLAIQGSVYNIRAANKRYYTGDDSFFVHEDYTASRKICGDYHNDKLQLLESNNGHSPHNWSKLRICGSRVV